MENERKKGPEFRIALSRKKTSSLCVLCVCLCSLCVHVIFFVPRKDEKKKVSIPPLSLLVFWGVVPQPKQARWRNPGRSPTKYLIPDTVPDTYYLIPNT